MNDDLEASVDGARQADARGELADWVNRFLGSDGSDNAELGDQLAGDKWAWLGPVELRFDELHRLAGPADQPTIGRLDSSDIETVDGMAESIEGGWEPAPLIVSYGDDHFVVEDGNHRIEGLRRAGRDRYWSIIAFDTEHQRSDFIARAERIEEVLELERAGWNSLCDGTGSDFYGTIMTDDARMVLANGMVMTRAQVVAALDDAPPWASYEIDDPRVVPITEESVALLYTGTGHRDDGDDFSGVMSSVYVRIDDHWRLALYQQTPTD